MADVSMCSDLACPSRKGCYRSPESGTRPKSRAQTWFHFGRPAGADRCAEFWPAETAVPTIAGRFYLQNQGAV